ncbi:MAG: hypothetical protein CSA26_02815 [Desulfobacterales bacterium]|nr:MAG: hypothetical protein CSA26_02815 [Desulfobacterales bacterium]
MKQTARRTRKTIIYTLVLLSTIFSSTVYAEDNALLRIAVLPIPDILPIYVAEENGYFSDLGINVEILTIGSAVERDQLMQASRIDGMLNEIGGAALFNREKQRLRIISYARIPLQDAPLFRILAAPKSGITQVSELQDVAIAVSKNTVIEYITRRLLEQQGIAAKNIKFASVPVLPERMQLLLAGQIKAATLPDPLGFAAIQAGAAEIINDLRLPELSASVLSFSQEAVSGKSETIQKFIIAWNKAAEDLNADPETYRPLMLKKIRVPKHVQQSFTIPQYPTGKVPTQKQWDDVNEWLVAQGLLKKAVDYQISVTDEFVTR